MSFDIIIHLMQKLVPIVQDSNLVFNDAGYVELVFTKEQLVLMNGAEDVPAPQENRRRRREPRRYLCGICRQEGHNRMRCPLRNQNQNQIQNQVNDIVNEAIIAPQPAREVIQIE